MFAKIIKNKVAEYPSDPYNQNPNVTFPENWQGGVVNKTEYVLVHGSDVPKVNSNFIIEQSTPVQNNGIWYQTWVTKPNPNPVTTDNPIVRN